MAQLAFDPFEALLRGIGGIEGGFACALVGLSTDGDADLGSIGTSGRGTTRSGSSSSELTALLCV